MNGTPCKLWDSVRTDKLQIFSTRSLGKRITSSECLNQALAKHASIAAAKAREQGSLCSTLMVFASNSPFDDNPRSYKFLHRFNPATNDTSHFLKAISENIYLLFNSNISYYKIGVGLLNLCSEAHLQWDLLVT